jgi:hypothetical protein
MKFANCFLGLTALFLAPQLQPQSARTAEQPTESEHRRGPNELEGWTLNYPFPGRPEDRYPRTLVLSQNGRILHRFVSQHYIWNWIYWANGRQVAYEDGPPHFSMQCILADVATGQVLASNNCFGKLPDDAPPWLQTLEKRSNATQ